MEQQLTEKQVAELLGLSVHWLRQRRCYGGGPPYRRLGRSVRYPAGNLLHWIEQQPFFSEASAEPEVPNEAS